MPDHLATLIDDFRRFGAQIAVVRYQGNRRRVATYGDLAQLAGRFAQLLADRDIIAGDRILLWAENSAEWIGAFYGCMLRGVLVVPLDAYGTSDFAARVAADVQPKLAVGDVLLLRQLPSGLPRLAFEDWATAVPSEEAGAIPGLNKDTPLQVLFTSGTTGDPKGIVHTHGNVMASIGPIEQAAQKYLRYERYAHPLRFLHTLPLSHVFGQTMGLWVPPIFRAEVHLESRLVAPRLIEIIRRERISVLAAVPRVFAILKTHLEARMPELTDRLAVFQSRPAGKFGWKRWWRFRGIHRTFGLKFWALISGGGALPDAVEQFWNGLGFVVVQGYGMTETTALITLNHPFHVAGGTIGKPLPGRDVKIGPEGEVYVRGPMISSATWSGGQIRPRQDDWLATGDLAEAQATGELRFLGRKSEVIVTGAGVNIHPEDLEAALENQPGVAAATVVPFETAAGPEPCAVLAMRGDAGRAGPAVEKANTRLAEFQTVRRWLVWPDPDLPRTSSGKVRRKAVAAWVAGSLSTSNRSHASTNAFAGDWLLSLIAEITGEAPQCTDPSARLNEDFHLDSLGRVQLAAAIEEKLGMPPESGLLEQAQSLRDLRALVGSGRESAPTLTHPILPFVAHSTTNGFTRSAAAHGNGHHGAPAVLTVEAGPAPADITSRSAPAQSRSIYPRWPWSWPVRWLRNAFTELVSRPLVWFLAAPRVVAPELISPAGEPMLIVANHVTTYDGALVQYALPGAMRRRIAAAMSGEILEDFRHFRNPDRPPGTRSFSPFGPFAYLLLTALFNVFPLPRLRDFQRSFSHAGEALDRGYSVLVFPEGTRSNAGQLAPFRPGIGLLARQSHAPVLPVALRGLGDLKSRGRGWFRSGKIEIRVGEPIRFAPETSETAITQRLHAAVAALLAADQK